MARRPSTVSLSSVSSSTTTGIFKLAQLPPPVSRSFSQSSNGSANGATQWLPIRKASLNVTMPAVIEQSGDSSVSDTDALFTKHTVQEVKAIQQRFRADADAKQQELRLMVGYVHNASTSIIEIAQSSQNVQHAFDEMRRVSAASRPSVIPASSAAGGDEDVYLHALQSLSAHMKLLLDAPEHLWRLMEKRRYLHAAWLFLLSRVVHQALLIEEDGDDSQWSGYGIHVPEQFPLVQRQWDTISQFRTQITHKATLFLREHTLSSSDTCAALLTLHLLESRPLPVTATIFLTQRTRALTTLLNRSRGSANGSAPEVSSSTSSLPQSSKATVRSVRQRAEAALQIVSQTIGIVRIIFLGDESSSTSLVSEVLTFISTETPPPEWVPQELRLTTQTLLLSLPSSSHYGLLPSNIKGYKPYIDDASITSSTIRSQVEEQMRDWSRDALHDLEKAVDLWLAELKSIRDVWQLRSYLRSWVNSVEGLIPEEKLQLGQTVNNWCLKRTRQIWRTEIDATKSAFRSTLSATLVSGRDDLSASLSGTQASKHIFQPPPLPSLQNHLTPSNALASVEKYRKSLQRQLSGRTEPLNNVLEGVESRLRGLHNDLDFVKADDVDSVSSTTDLLQSYHEDARSLCDEILTVLQDTLTDIGDATVETIGSIVFIGKVASELSSSSLFRSDLDCSPQQLEGFKQNTRSIHDQTLEKWRDFSVREAIRKHWSFKPATDHHKITMTKDGHHRSSPSSAILSALVSLSSSMQELGSSLDPERRRAWSLETLNTFTCAFLDHVAASCVEHWQESMQTYWDLCLLSQICGTWGEDAGKISEKVHGRIFELRNQLASEGTAEGLLQDDTMPDHLSRTQMLLNALLHPIISPSAPANNGKSANPSSLLRFGVPTPDAQFEPGVDIVKPALRLGLLLVKS
ncbi:hypothetical protein BXZ70DRAFT_1030293 [Cristinia sonorae]|uniref:Conserved oligomeric Golgi complex subunit 1 n=1 Tax=Cristinia sonorae TaxID=1940300 RepID=A0A8K0UM91_9AGAR|nr:hypothetical protein BXZ70DRAFT_1030293 [Cristinia sonorae]